MGGKETRRRKKNGNNRINHKQRSMAMCETLKINMVDQKRKKKWKELGRRRRRELYTSKQNKVERGSQTSCIEDGNDTEGEEALSDNMMETIWESEVFF